MGVRDSGDASGNLLNHITVLNSKSVGVKLVDGNMKFENLIIADVNESFLVTDKNNASTLESLVLTQSTGKQLSNDLIILKNSKTKFNNYVDVSGEINFNDTTKNRTVNVDGGYACAPKFVVSNTHVLEIKNNLSLSNQIVVQNGGKLRAGRSYSFGSC